MTLKTIRRLATPSLIFFLTACTFGFDPNAPPIITIATSTPGGNAPQGGETASVVRVIDGDTIDVNLNGQTVRVRYIGMNTPESNEPCYAEATAANALFVQNKTVQLVKDVSETDIYGRLLRYVYVGDLFVNRALVEQGYAEVVSYPPDNAHYDEFLQLEKEATAAKRGCHVTTIFNDGSYTR
jgi:endonuclease YncB( thermonuclease family)